MLERAREVVCYLAGVFTEAKAPGVMERRIVERTEGCDWD
jgi:hypothetical protein